MFNSIAELISLIYIKSNVVISSIKQGVLTGERVYKMNFNKLFASILLLAVSTSPAFAAFPEKDIKVIIGVSPGGGFDTSMRALIPILEKYLGNDVNVLPINSAGSGGRRGALETFKAKPDGYTIGMFNMPGVLIPQLTENDVGYDLEKITWLATLGNDPYAFIVNKDSDLISFDQVLAQKSPILFGATGPSSTSYVATVIMNETLGIPYEVVTGYTGSSAAQHGNRACLYQVRGCEGTGDDRYEKPGPKDCRRRQPRQAGSRQAQCRPHDRRTSWSAGRHQGYL